jgi:hypothetical protein
MFAEGSNSGRRRLSGIVNVRNMLWALGLLRMQAICGVSICIGCNGACMESIKIMIGKTG